MLDRLLHLDEEVFDLLGRVMITADDLPRKRAGELEIGDETSFGRVSAVEPGEVVDYGGDSPTGMRPGVTVTCHVSGDSIPCTCYYALDEEVVLGPPTRLERWWDRWERISSIVYQRRRRGRVSYHLGPIAIYCTRRPLRATLGWVGFARFRAAAPFKR